MRAIFAVNKVDGFGLGTSMPWPRSQTDLQRFRSLTVGGTVIMGASTWASDMPTPLPGRRNCVLSTTLVDPRCEVYSDTHSLLADIGDSDNAWVIGGARTLWQLRPHIHTVYLTRHHIVHKADVYLDTAQYLRDYTLHSREELDELTFDIYTRA